MTFELELDHQGELSRQMSRGHHRRSFLWS